MMNQFCINFGFVLNCVKPLRLKRLSGSQEIINQNTSNHFDFEE